MLTNFVLPFGILSITSRLVTLETALTTAEVLNTALLKRGKVEIVKRGVVFGYISHKATDPVVQHSRHVTLSPVPGQAVLHGGAAAVFEDEDALQKTRRTMSASSEAARAIARQRPRDL